MKIIFNLMNCGLGNNGGSTSIVRSANTLSNLGVEVLIIDSISNKHTWNPLKVKHIIIKDNSQVPDADFVIATGYTTVGSTLELPIRCGKKVHWIRGWESWKLSEDEIIKQILSAKTIKLVNSICLQRKLDSLGFKSEIVRPGYDFDEIYPLNIRSGKEVIIGALYNEGMKRRSKRTSWCFDAISFLKRNHKNIKFQMFGSEGVPASGLIDKFVKNPTMKEKNYFYNECDIWLAPTELEGLHIPPAEAMLTECTVVGTSSPMSGMQDYLENGKTGLVSNNTIGSFIKNINSLVISDRTRKVLGSNGRNKILELGSRENNMKNMVEFLYEKWKEND